MVKLSQVRDTTSIALNPVVTANRRGDGWQSQRQCFSLRRTIGKNFPCMYDNKLEMFIHSALSIWQFQEGSPFGDDHPLRHSLLHPLPEYISI